MDTSTAEQKIPAKQRQRLLIKVVVLLARVWPSTVGRRLAID